MVTRKSVDVSSTPISADELNSVRAIVFAKISSTSTASIALSNASTAASIAASQRGPVQGVGRSAAAATPAAGDGLVSISALAACVREPGRFASTTSVELDAGAL